MNLTYVIKSRTSTGDVRYWNFQSGFHGNTTTYFAHKFPSELVATSIMNEILAERPRHSRCQDIRVEVVVDQRPDQTVINNRELQYVFEP